MASYQPPFTITAKIIHLIAKISEQVGRISVTSHAMSLQLRRINRIRTIRGSLAIEGNTLSEQQITAVLHGKHVIAPPRDIQEVKNALLAYESLTQWQASNEQHMLEAHRQLMLGLIDELGMYRQGGVGVMSGQTIVHMAPPAKRVPSLMHDLLQWIQHTEDHPLIVAAVFHYEFEFIHPFADGNGRMGRLWQTLILYQWQPVFADIPVESLIHAHQEAYYQALQEATDHTDSACFIAWMLELILQVLVSNLNTEATAQVTAQATAQAEKLLVFCYQPRSREDMMAHLGLQHRENFRSHVLQPLLQAGLLLRTLPDKPTSPKQQYYAP